MAIRKKEQRKTTTKGKFRRAAEGELRLFTVRKSGVFLPGQGQHFTDKQMAKKERDKLNKAYSRAHSKTKTVKGKKQIVELVAGPYIVGYGPDHDKMRGTS